MKATGLDQPTGRCGSACQGTADLFRPVKRIPATPDTSRVERYP